eukprot:8580694-Heterocapsa_arctica.AAC.1
MALLQINRPERGRKRSRMSAPENNNLELPNTMLTRNEGITDEQTNNSFFNGKEVRIKARLNAEQIQAH